MFELSTNVDNLKQLRQGDYSAYDALYLGDFSCPEYPNNFCSHPETLQPLRLSPTKINAVMQEITTLCATS